MKKSIYIILFLIFTSAHATTGLITGLGTGKSLVIKNSVTTKIITANGAYQIADGGQITVAIQPSSQICKVIVTDIICANAYTVGGLISGASNNFVLRMNESTLIVPANAMSYRFSTLLPINSTYLISVGIQPTNIKCTVSNASGIIQANVTNANITCVPYVSAVVLWTAPTMNTDGTPLVDLTNYILYYGTDPALNSYATRLIPASALTTTVTNLLPNTTYYFSIASVSASGGVGARSNIASVTK